MTSRLINSYAFNSSRQKQKKQKQNKHQKLLYNLRYQNIFLVHCSILVIKNEWTVAELVGPNN